ncbi:helix-turn-helix domain-containing protein [Halobacterium rubrum]|uniref:helix-turn-helix domain-containing protein n=1 Tax=Halobacterium TaxID=2239 RepID=UPI001F3E386D|nr:MULTISPECIES: helix-turn-helix domain-containing protein [Halobacterium]MDH5020908.1 helix-turn-helix domain-containing protein [Halobacterium rubrum]
MSTPIRAEVRASDLHRCPVARASADADGRVTHVARSTATTRDGCVTEEFAVEDAASSLPREGFDDVLEFERRDVYRFERPQNRGCVCECIERHGCPVADVRARDGDLYVSFYAADVETVQDALADLQDWFDDVTVRQLTQSSDDDDDRRDAVVVDRGRLTARQREVLETCVEMGYFEHPREANGTEVASALGISPATFREHLAAAQRGLLESVLDC